MNLTVVKRNGKSKKSLLTALAELSSWDADFNRDNGDSYLLPEAKKAGFETNLDYVLDKIEKEYANAGVTSEKALVEAFVFEWTNTDRSFYQEWECEVALNPKTSAVEAIAFCFN